jgi:hypothetical protein
MSERNAGRAPAHFFDFIIDECHRGAAIPTYFAPAVQFGLTATPTRKDNVDGYAYFGQPVYIYSLREGINDDFLTRFKAQQIATTLDDHVYTVPHGTGRCDQYPWMPSSSRHCRGTAGRAVRGRARVGENPGLRGDGSSCRESRCSWGTSHGSRAGERRCKPHPQLTPAVRRLGSVSV